MSRKDDRNLTESSVFQYGHHYINHADYLFPDLKLSKPQREEWGKFCNDTNQFYKFTSSLSENQYATRYYSKVAEVDNEIRERVKEWHSADMRVNDLTAASRQAFAFKRENKKLDDRISDRHSYMENVGNMLSFSAHYRIARRVIEEIDDTEIARASARAHQAYHQLQNRVWEEEAQSVSDFVKQLTDEKYRRFKKPVQEANKSQLISAFEKLNSNLEGKTKHTPDVRAHQAQRFISLAQELGRTGVLSDEVKVQCMGGEKKAYEFDLYLEKAQMEVHKGLKCDLTVDEKGECEQQYRVYVSPYTEQSIYELNEKKRAFFNSKREAYLEQKRAFEDQRVDAILAETHSTALSYKEWLFLLREAEERMIAEYAIDAGSALEDKARDYIEALITSFSVEEGEYERCIYATKFFLALHLYRSNFDEPISSWLGQKTIDELTPYFEGSLVHKLNGEVALEWACSVNNLIARAKRDKFHRLWAEQLQDKPTVVMGVADKLYLQQAHAALNKELLKENKNTSNLARMAKVLNYRLSYYKKYHSEPSRLISKIETKLKSTRADLSNLPTELEESEATLRQRLEREFHVTQNTALPGGTFLEFCHQAHQNVTRFDFDSVTDFAFAAEYLRAQRSYFQSEAEVFNGCLTGKNKLDFSIRADNLDRKLAGRLNEMAGHAADRLLSAQNYVEFKDEYRQRVYALVDLVRDGELASKFDCLLRPYPANSNGESLFKEKMAALLTDFPNIFSKTINAVTDDLAEVKGSDAWSKKSFIDKSLVHDLGLDKYVSKVAKALELQEDDFNKHVFPNEGSREKNESKRKQLFQRVRERLEKRLRSVIQDYETGECYHIGLTGTALPRSHELIEAERFHAAIGATSLGAVNRQMFSFPKNVRNEEKHNSIFARFSDDECSILYSKLLELNKTRGRESVEYTYQVLMRLVAEFGRNEDIQAKVKSVFEANGEYGVSLVLDSKLGVFKPKNVVDVLLAVENKDGLEGLRKLLQGYSEVVFRINAKIGNLEALSSKLGALIRPRSSEISLDARFDNIVRLLQQERYQDVLLRIEGIQEDIDSLKAIIDSAECEKTGLKEQLAELCKELEDKKNHYLTPLKVAFTKLIRDKQNNLSNEFSSSPLDSSAEGYFSLLTALSNLDKNAAVEFAANTNYAKLFLQQLINRSNEFLIEDEELSGEKYQFSKVNQKSLSAFHYSCQQFCKPVEKYAVSTIASILSDRDVLRRFITEADSNGLDALKIWVNSDLSSNTFSQCFANINKGIHYELAEAAFTCFLGDEPQAKSWVKNFFSSYLQHFLPLSSGIFTEELVVLSKREAEERQKVVAQKLEARAVNAFVNLDSYVSTNIRNELRQLVDMNSNDARRSIQHIYESATDFFAREKDGYDPAMTEYVDADFILELEHVCESGDVPPVSGHAVSEAFAQKYISYVTNKVYDNIFYGDFTNGIKKVLLHTNIDYRLAAFVQKPTLVGTDDISQFLAGYEDPILHWMYVNLLTKSQLHDLVDYMFDSVSQLEGITIQDQFTYFKKFLKSISSLLAEAMRSDDANEIERHLLGRVKPLIEPSQAKEIGEDKRKLYSMMVFHYGDTDTQINELSKVTEAEKYVHTAQYILRRNAQRRDYDIEVARIKSSDTTTKVADLPSQQQRQDQIENIKNESDKRHDDIVGKVVEAVIRIKSDEQFYETHEKMAEQDWGNRAQVALEKEHIKRKFRDFLGEFEKTKFASDSTAKDQQEKLRLEFSSLLTTKLGLMRAAFLDETERSEYQDFIEKVYADLVQSLRSREQTSDLRVNPYFDSAFTLSLSRIVDAARADAINELGEEKVRKMSLSNGALFKRLIELGDEVNVYQCLEDALTVNFNSQPDPVVVFDQFSAAYENFFSDGAAPLGNRAYSVAYRYVGSELSKATHFSDQNRQYLKDKLGELDTLGYANWVELLLTNPEQLEQDAVLSEKNRNLYARYARRLQDFLAKTKTGISEMIFNQEFDVSGEMIDGDTPEAQWSRKKLSHHSVKIIGAAQLYITKRGYTYHGQDVTAKPDAEAKEIVANPSNLAWELFSRIVTLNKSVGSASNPEIEGAIPKISGYGKQYDSYRDARQISQELHQGKFDQAAKKIQALKDKLLEKVNAANGTKNAQLDLGQYKLMYANLQKKVIAQRVELANVEKAAHCLKFIERINEHVSKKKRDKKQHKASTEAVDSPDKITSDIKSLFPHLKKGKLSDLKSGLIKEYKKLHFAKYSDQKIQNRIQEIDSKKIALESSEERRRLPDEVELIESYYQSLRAITDLTTGMLDTHSYIDAKQDERSRLRDGLEKVMTALPTQLTQRQIKYRDEATLAALAQVEQVNKSIQSTYKENRYSSIGQQSTKYKRILEENDIDKKIIAKFIEDLKNITDEVKAPFIDLFKQLQLSVDVVREHTEDSTANIKLAMAHADEIKQDYDTLSCFLLSLKNSFSTSKNLRPKEIMTMICQAGFDVDRSSLSRMTYLLSKEQKAELATSASFMIDVIEKNGLTSPLISLFELISEQFAPIPKGYAREVSLFDAKMLRLKKLQPVNKLRSLITAAAKSESAAKELLAYVQTLNFTDLKNIMTSSEDVSETFITQLLEDAWNLPCGQQINIKFFEELHVNPEQLTKIKNTPAALQIIENIKTSFKDVDIWGVNGHAEFDELLTQLYAGQPSSALISALPKSSREDWQKYIDSLNKKVITGLKKQAQERHEEEGEVDSSLSSLIEPVASLVFKQAEVDSQQLNQGLVEEAVTLATSELRSALHFHSSALFGASSGKNHRTESQRLKNKIYVENCFLLIKNFGSKEQQQEINDLLETVYWHYLRYAATGEKFPDEYAKEGATLRYNLLEALFRCSGIIEKSGLISMASRERRNNDQLRKFSATKLMHGEYEDHCINVADRARISLLDWHQSVDAAFSELTNVEIEFEDQFWALMLCITNDKPGYKELRNSANNDGDQWRVEQFRSAIEYIFEKFHVVSLQQLKPEELIIIDKMLPGFSELVALPNSNKDFDSTTISAFFEAANHLLENRAILGAAKLLPTKSEIKEQSISQLVRTTDRLCKKIHFPKGSFRLDQMKLNLDFINQKAQCAQMAVEKTKAEYQVSEQAVYRDEQRCWDLQFYYVRQLIEAGQYKEAYYELSIYLANAEHVNPEAAMDTLAEVLYQHIIKASQSEGLDVMQGILADIENSNLMSLVAANNQERFEHLKTLVIDCSNSVMLRNDLHKMIDVIHSEQPSSRISELLSYLKFSAPYTYSDFNFILSEQQRDRLLPINAAQNSSWLSGFMVNLTNLIELGKFTSMYKYADSADAVLAREELVNFLIESNLFNNSTEEVASIELSKSDLLSLANKAKAALISDIDKERQILTWRLIASEYAKAPYDNQRQGILLMPHEFKIILEYAPSRAKLDLARDLLEQIKKDLTNHFSDISLSDYLRSGALQFIRDYLESQQSSIISWSEFLTPVSSLAYKMMFEMHLKLFAADSQLKPNIKDLLNSGEIQAGEVINKAIFASTLCVGETKKRIDRMLSRWSEKMANKVVASIGDEENHLVNLSKEIDSIVANNKQRTFADNHIHCMAAIANECARFGDEGFKTMTECWAKENELTLDNAEKICNGLIKKLFNYLNTNRKMKLETDGENIALDLVRNEKRKAVMQETNQTGFIANLLSVMRGDLESARFHDWAIKNKIEAEMLSAYISNNRSATDNDILKAEEILLFISKVDRIRKKIESFKVDVANEKCTQTHAAYQILLSLDRELDIQSEILQHLKSKEYRKVIDNFKSLLQGQLLLPMNRLKYMLQRSEVYSDSHIKMIGEVHPGLLSEELERRVSHLRALITNVMRKGDLEKEEEIKLYQQLCAVLTFSRHFTGALPAHCENTLMDGVHILLSSPKDMVHKILSLLTHLYLKNNLDIGRKIVEKAFLFFLLRLMDGAPSDDQLALVKQGYEIIVAQERDGQYMIYKHAGAQKYETASLNENISMHLLKELLQGLNTNEQLAFKNGGVILSGMDYWKVRKLLACKRITAQFSISTDLDFIRSWTNLTPVPLRASESNRSNRHLPENYYLSLVEKIGCYMKNVEYFECEHQASEMLTNTAVRHLESIIVDRFNMLKGDDHHDSMMCAALNYSVFANHFTFSNEAQEKINSLYDKQEIDSFELFGSLMLVWEKVHNDKTAHDEISKLFDRFILKLTNVLQGRLDGATLRKLDTLFELVPDILSRLDGFGRREEFCTMIGCLRGACSYLEQALSMKQKGRVLHFSLIESKNRFQKIQQERASTYFDLKPANGGENLKVLIGLISTHYKSACEEAVLSPEEKTQLFESLAAQVVIDKKSEQDSKQYQENETHDVRMLNNLQNLVREKHTADIIFDPQCAETVKKLQASTTRPERAA